MVDQQLTRGERPSYLGDEAEIEEKGQVTTRSPGVSFDQEWCFVPSP